MNPAGPSFSRNDDLTGLWSGEYWYRAGGGPTPFIAHIVDMAGDLTGTTLERSNHGGEWAANITGVRSGLSVRFTKTYDGGPHTHAIYYTGTVDADFALIEGEWSFGPLNPDWTGRFVLVRTSRGPRAAAEARAAQEVIRR